jgi:hypothetical protein
MIIGEKAISSNNLRKRFYFRVFAGKRTRMIMEPAIAKLLLERWCEVWDCESSDPINGCEGKCIQTEGRQRGSSARARPKRRSLFFLPAR